MNRNEIKKFLAEKQELIYTNPIYENFCTTDYTIYDPSYKKNNYSNFAYFQSKQEVVNAATLLTHSKLFAHYHANDLLYKMQLFAKVQQQIVVPVRLIHWRRRQRLEKMYFHFQAAQYSYLIIPQHEFSEKERRKYIDYIRKLDWNSHLP